LAGPTIEAKVEEKLEEKESDKEAKALRQKVK
jgi:hypothetical protein